MNVLEIHQLNKRFREHQVIDGLELTVPEHAVFGFIGQNGAGKTTTMKMVLGLLKPDSGSITICGESVRYGETKSNRHVGYLPDVPEYYGYMNAREYLALCGEITGLPKKRIQERSGELLELVGLGSTKKRISGFSRGMKQRLGIAQALLHEPRLLICDEPTSALDPVGRKEILDVLYAAKGKTTVLLSTHILTDVERICDHVAILHGGKLALNGTLSELKEGHRQDGYALEFRSAEEAARFAECMKSNRFAATVAQEGTAIKVQLQLSGTLGGGQSIIGLLAHQQLTPVRFEALEPTLENLFMEVIQ
ncbi:ABC transporter ATP-binding protein [Paenibacillus brevis]|uniref:ABC transporter ATP-binding protein n=1 Tax=Paenibacillus brevis TaxID=2841508 RepID=A0ABS6FQ63_9BACL|nr:ABC transporter ATP-binding protein [Paenibacillus brevis]MBU5671593.1 ABC transporter ATP-binding protein [Paenibacillus brevis]